MELLNLTWPQWALIASSYLIVIRALRYRRRNKVPHRFPTREAMATMTVEQAYEIQADLGEMEVPYFFNTGLFFGFFKVSDFPANISQDHETY